jgi:hypothetical protein
MAKTSNRPNLIVLALVVIAVAIAAYAWVHKRRESTETPPATTDKTAVATSEALAIPSDRIDPANEGKLVKLSGDLSVKAPASDTQLGITADAIMLLRFAEMLQWREQCTGANCTYQQVWSPQLIASAKFRTPEGHKNPDHPPFTTARFSTNDLRLGAFRIDAAALGNQRLGSSLQAKPVPYPVSSAKLPSNLAITFRDVNGALYAGDPEHRVVGDVRVSYRIIPAGKIDIVGIQRGERVIVQKSSAGPTPQP